jgi:hypothetical protein
VNSSAIFPTWPLGHLAAHNRASIPQPLNQQNAYRALGLKRLRRYIVRVDNISVSVTRRTAVRDRINVVDDLYDIYARECGRNIQARYEGTGSSSQGETGNVTRRVGTKRWQRRSVCWLRGHQIFDAGQLDSKTAETKAGPKRFGEDWQRGRGFAQSQWPMVRLHTKTEGKFSDFLRGR